MLSIYQWVCINILHKTSYNSIIIFDHYLADRISITLDEGICQFGRGWGIKGEGGLDHLDGSGMRIKKRQEDEIVGKIIPKDSPISKAPMPLVNGSG